MNGETLTFNQNIFDRQVTALRRQSQQNMDARAAMNYVKQIKSSSANVSTAAISGAQLPRADVLVRELTDSEIDRRALYDDTGVYNFRFTLRTLLDELTRCRTFNRPVTLMVVAISDHKTIGTNYGELALDSVLSASAEALIDCCRAVDMVGRFMEDRFVVVFPETDLKAAIPIAENVRMRIERITLQHQWHKVSWKANIGLSQFPDHGLDAESLIALADIAADELSHGDGGILIAPKL